MLVRLPKNFAKRIKTGETASVQVVMDSTNSNQTIVVLRYLGAIINDYTQELMKERMQRLGLVEAKAPVDVEHRICFNENLDSRWSFVPGVIAMVAMLVSLMLTALAVNLHHGAAFGLASQARGADPGQDRALRAHCPGRRGSGHGGRRLLV